MLLEECRDPGRPAAPIRIIAVVPELNGGVMRPQQAAHPTELDEVAPVE